MNSNILQEDLENLLNASWLPWDQLQQKAVLITGASGLIGSNMVRGLTYVNRKLDLNMSILALVRDKHKALKKFADLADDVALSIIQADVEYNLNFHQKIDFIIHGASPTASSYFIENPVETIKTVVNGTVNMLELAKVNKVEGFVYLSSMEVYGAPQNEDLLSEKDVGYMNPLLVRNCYPESKRMCEALCAAYAEEYNIPAMSIRLAQTFGVGVEKNDTRVFAEFARCVENRQDIVLLTDGGSKRCYLYTMDAVSAILTVLLKGERGKAYNAGNVGTYCSIKEMAQMVVHKLANDEITVKFSENLENCKEFSFPHFYHLDITEISKLGWKATWGLREMYVRMMGNV